VYVYITMYKQKQTPWPESRSELYRPSDGRLSAKLVPTFADRGVPRSQRGRSPTAVISGFLDRSSYFFLSSSSIVLTRLSRPRSGPTTSQNILQRQESNPDLWICRQEL
jgi:hypothetical protein